MKLVARLKSINEIKNLINLGVDVFCIDTALTVKAINKDLFNSLDLVTKEETEVYLIINKMIHEEDIDILRKILEKAKKYQVSGIVASDMTVMIMAEEYGLKNKIIYQPGTFNTNSFDNDYFYSLGIKGITLSKEITIEEMVEIAKGKKLEYSLVGHGYLDMFYSRRKLLSNYFIFKNVEHPNVKNNHNFRLKEEIRDDSAYPIIEDEYGTYIFRDKAQISFDEVNTLNNFIDDFFIERLFLDDQEYYLAIKAYKDSLFQPEFLANYKDKYSSNFYYLYTEKIKGDTYED